MRVFICLLVFIVCMLCSCDKDSETTTIDIPDKVSPDNHTEKVGPTVSAKGEKHSDEYSFIQVYVDADTLMGMQRNFIDDGNPPCTYLYPCMYLYLDGKGYDWNGAYGDDSDNTWKIFQQYSEQLGDTTMPSSEANWHVCPNSVSVIINKIEGIDVFCNDNFDKNHPKGSSVSDILTFYGSTPAKYIKRGYVWIGLTHKVPQGISTKYPDLIECNAATIADNNVEFYSRQFYLYFDKLPEKNGTYTFDVVIKFVDKELRSVLTMVF